MPGREAGKIEIEKKKNEMGGIKRGRGELFRSEVTLR